MLNPLSFTSVRPLPSRRMLVLMALLFWGTAGMSWIGKAEEQEPPQKSVKLVVDYADGTKKEFSALEWKTGMTVFAALEAAAKHPRGIKLEYQGKGETILITAIDELKNEGKGRNWLYEVNGKLADRSSGIMELKAGDSVLWRFGKYK